MSRIEWWKNLVANEAAKELLRVVVPAAGLLALSALSSLSLTGLLGLSLWVTVPLFVLVSSVVLSVAWAAFRRWDRRVVRYKPLEHDFEIERLEVRYEYQAIDKMVYRRSMSLKALKNNLDRYSDKYSWSGTGDVSARAHNVDQQFVLTRRRNVWQHYDVYFGHALNKGDHIQVVLEWTLEDVLGTATDFCSVTVDRPMNELEFVVKLYPGCETRSANLEQCRGIDLGHPYQVDEVDFDDDGLLRWSLSRPKLGHYYQVSWTDPSRRSPV